MNRLLKQSIHTNFTVNLGLYCDVKEWLTKSFFLCLWINGSSFNYNFGWCIICVNTSLCFSWIFFIIWYI